MSKPGEDLLPRRVVSQEARLENQGRYDDDLDTRGHCFKRVYVAVVNQVSPDVRVE